MVATSSWVGSIPAWVTLAMLLAVAWRLTRGGAGSAVSELATANKVLEERLQEERAARERIGAEVRDLRVENAELRGRTDFATSIAGALAPLLEWTGGHELRAQERHEALMRANTQHLAILELVAARLGPEQWNGEERREAV